VYGASTLADIILLLVDREGFDSLCLKPLGELLDGMEGRALRALRPELDARFHRSFDVDIEGDVMEWSDAKVNLDPSKPLTEQGLDSTSSCELALALARWCSFGEWSCWDARLFLYIEPLLGRNLSGEEFLQQQVWSEFSESLSRIDRISYSESVVLDWMARRQGFGETMEPSEDPRILPTMESHRSTSESLFDFIYRARSEGLPILIGREFLEPELWNLDSQSLGEVIEVVA